LPSDNTVLPWVKFIVPWLFVLPWQLWATVADTIRKTTLKKIHFKKCTRYSRLDIDQLHWKTDVLQQNFIINWVSHGQQKHPCFRLFSSVEKKALAKLSKRLISKLLLCYWSVKLPDRIYDIHTHAQLPAVTGKRQPVMILEIMWNSFGRYQYPRFVFNAKKNFPVKRRYKCLEKVIWILPSTYVYLSVYDGNYLATDICRS